MLAKKAITLCAAVLILGSAAAFAAAATPGSGQAQLVPVRSEGSGRNFEEINRLLGRLIRECQKATFAGGKLNPQPLPPICVKVLPQG